MTYFAWVVMNLRAAHPEGGQYPMNEATKFFFFKSGSNMADWGMVEMNRFAHAMTSYFPEG